MKRPPGQFAERLRDAYASGAFPMADPVTSEIDFYCADPRATLPLDDRFHEPRSVRRDRRRGRFDLLGDTAFAEVVRGCAAPRRDSTAGDSWLSPRLIDWSIQLHEAGFAHSVEAWRRDAKGREKLVGGIYGVSVGRAFIAESMFHRARPRLPDGSRDPFDGTGASSVCLVALVQHLRACGYELLDVQIPNPHTERFGVVTTPLESFLSQLRRAADEEDAWRPFPAGAT